VTYFCFGRITCHDFSESRALSLSLSQHAPEALNEFSRATGSAEYDCLRGVGNVHAFVKHFGRDYHTVHAIVKVPKDLPTLALRRRVRDCRNQERTRDAIDELIVLCEDDRLITRMVKKELFKRFHLRP
jgi:hypothetical protein